MKFIAITGNFASGKSFVSNWFSEKKYKIFSCDEEVSELYLQESVKFKVVELLGIKFFSRKNISRIIYYNDAKRKMLENYIHPLIGEAISRFQKKHAHEQLLFAEVPLLFENDFAKYFDHIICVYCNEVNRLRRAKSRPNFDEEIYQKIKQIQLPYRTKIKMANFTINTDLDFADTVCQLENVLGRLKA